MSKKADVKIRLGMTPSECSVEVGGVDITEICNVIRVEAVAGRDDVTHVTLVMAPLHLDLQVDGEVIVTARELVAGEETD